jgi:hypothetical protein
VAGRTKPKAVEAFAEPIQRALTCFAHGKVVADTFEADTDGVLQFNGADDVRLNGPGRIHVSILMRYRIIRFEDERNPGKPWKIHTTGWIYELKDRDLVPIVEFHWHPQLTPRIPFPHLHPHGPIVRYHYPTGRVLIEDVLNMAVECGAEPIDPAKWDDVFSANVENFAKGATWGANVPRQFDATQE